MNIRKAVHKGNQFRLALCGHKAAEVGAVCILLMVQGHPGAITMAHVEIASKTGLLAVVPVLGVSFTRHARHFVNRWSTSAFLAACTFLADAAMHESHYPGEYTEAALTGMGAFVFSIAVSYTSVGKRIDEMAEHFLHPAGHKAPAAH